LNQSPSAGHPERRGHVDGVSRAYDGKRSQHAFDRRLTELASTQQGIFTRTQALDVGLSPDMIDRRLWTGRWQRLHTGVYRLAGPPITWRGSLVAASLACGPSAVVSHRAAAAHWRFPGSQTGIVELSVARSVRRVPANAIVHRVTAMEAVDVVEDGPLRFTSPALTLVDVAPGLDHDALEELLDDLLRRRLVTLPKLAWRLQRLGERRHCGVKAVRAILEQARRETARTESVFERKLLRLLRSAGLPEPVAQHEIRVHRRLVARVDFAYPDRHVAIEADSQRWHTGRTRWRRDLERRNALTTLGWHMIHVTWESLVRDPDRVASMVRRASGIDEPA
jgi:very-short-patch-repair endonuclease